MSYHGPQGVPTVGRRKPVAILIGVVIGLLFLESIFVVIAVVASLQGPQKPGSGTGIAYVKSCDQVGPFYRGLVGYYWQCTADITPNDKYAKAATVQFDINELTPDDIGKTVRYVKSGKNYKHNTERPFLKWGVGIIAAEFVGLVIWYAVRRGRKLRSPYLGAEARPYKVQVRQTPLPPQVAGFPGRSVKIQPERGAWMNTQHLYFEVTPDGVEWSRSSGLRFKLEWDEIAKIRLTEVTDSDGRVIRVVDLFPADSGFRGRHSDMASLRENGAVLHRVRVPGAKGAYRLPVAFKPSAARQLAEVMRALRPEKFEEIKAEI